MVRTKVLAEADDDGHSSNDASNNGARSPVSKMRRRGSKLPSCCHFERSNCGMDKNHHCDSNAAVWECQQYSSQL